MAVFPREVLRARQRSGDAFGMVLTDTLAEIRRELERVGGRILDVGAGAG